MASSRSILSTLATVIVGVVVLSGTGSAQAQRITFQAQTAEIAGSSFRHIKGELNHQDRLSASLEFETHDRWISQRELALQLDAQMDRTAWRVTLAPLRLPVVLDQDLSATLVLQAEMTGKELTTPELATLQLDINDLRYANTSGTTAAEALNVQSRLHVVPVAGNADWGFSDSAFEIQVSSQQGEALVGPAYLDFAKHPLQVQLSGKLKSLSPLHLLLTAGEVKQSQLLQAKAAMQTHLALTQSNLRPPEIGLEVKEAQVDLSLVLPAAYQSLFRTAVAGTLLGNLQTEGRITGAITINQNLPVQGRFALQDIALLDLRDQALKVEGLSGTLHWQDDAMAAPQRSELRWQSASLNGIDAGAARLGFLWQADDLSLLEPVRIPLLDGALRVESFSAQDLLSPARDVAFDGSLEPLSLSALTRALGWPELGGTLTGRAPGVRFRDGSLTLSGALEAEIFGGRIVGRNLRVDQAFSRWPRLTVDVDLENLDLALLTSTFDIGAISGRIGGQVLDLELFGWRPVAFDASIATVEDAPEPRRISVRAINSIANIGGSAGSGVSAALQSGLLRFFDNYRYRRMGLRCSLRDDVCLMSGTGPSTQRFGDRYTLLEGAGVPRLEIVGYAGRVKWSQLVEQISAQIRSGALPQRAP